MGDLDRRNVGALLALVVHDLRNPLSALHSNAGFLDVLLKSGDTETREVLADFVLSCASLAHIIENLEFIGMAVAGPLDAGSMVIKDRGSVSLAGAVHDAIQRTKAIVESYGAKVTQVLPEGRGPHVLVYRDLLTRSLGNLLVNAAQHARRDVPVTISVSVREGEGVISVSDDGDPLPVEFREIVFGPDGQIASKRHPLGRYSRGLGLYAAAIAAELSGARVRAAATGEGASLFELSAPLAS
jgi:signal transduction histidine kinase